MSGRSPDALSNPVIEVRDLNKVYRLGDLEVHALHGVSLAIERGEFVAVMGASGLTTCIYAITKISFTYQFPLVVFTTLRGSVGDPAGEVLRADPPVVVQD